MKKIRKFSNSLGIAAVAFLAVSDAISAPALPKPLTPEEQQTLNLINANRPSQLKALPADFHARFGATHSDGKYHLTEKPFLIEGAEKLLDMGTRLGKFWFTIPAAKKCYPFNSTWPESETLVELAETDYFKAVWKMPFKTILLMTSSPSEQGWRKADLSAEYYTKITKDYYELSAHFYRVYQDRPVTIVFQNWEGDWLLRGIGVKWEPPSADWQERCSQMQRWIAARQAGVNKARKEFGKQSKCIVAHAVEVNRVADAWKGIPTLTRNVLPGVEVDLVSYSAYDGINSGEPLLFWKCLEEIRQHIRTGPLFGPGAIMVGEYGIPENDKPERIRERCDEMLGVMLAKKVLFAAHWELYCNEFAGKPEELKANPPVTPVKDLNLMRGFWLVKPNGELGESGKYFQELWTRAETEKKKQAINR